jgi:uncharacterized membrane protein
MNNTVTYIIEASRPFDTVYEWFTDYKNFRILDHILDVSRWQIDGKEGGELGGTLLWRVKFGNRFIEYAAEIIKASPTTITWRSADGQNGGDLNFERINDDETKITVALYYPGSDTVSPRSPLRGLPLPPIIVCKTFPPPP